MITKELINEAFEYDKEGRMRAHPLYHPNQGKRFSEDELMYLCKFWEVVESRREMSYALGRTETTLASKITVFKRSGSYEYYKNMYDRKVWGNGG